MQPGALLKTYRVISIESDDFIVVLLYLFTYIAFYVLYALFIAATTRYTMTLSGFLTKRDSSEAGYRKRWIVLSGNHIRFYASKRDQEAGIPPKVRTLMT